MACGTFFLRKYFMRRGYIPGVMCILRDVTFIRIRNERVVLQSIQVFI
jgi:hypothetical protein